MRQVLKNFWYGFLNGLTMGGLFSGSRRIEAALDRQTKELNKSFSELEEEIKELKNR